MPAIDPVVRFWVGVAITIAIGIANGSLVLTHAVPDAWIPYVTAWAGIISFVGSAILTAMNGFASTTQSRIASAAADASVHQIIATPDVAKAAPSDKVVEK